MRWRAPWGTAVLSRPEPVLERSALATTCFAQGTDEEALSRAEVVHEHARAGRGRVGQVAQRDAGQPWPRRWSAAASSSAFQRGIAENFAVAAPVEEMVRWSGLAPRISNDASSWPPATRRSHRSSRSGSSGRSACWRPAMSDRGDQLGGRLRGPRLVPAPLQAADGPHARAYRQRFQIPPVSAPA
jgi:hypothetical protein